MVRELVLPCFRGIVTHLSAAVAGVLCLMLLMAATIHPAMAEQFVNHVHVKQHMEGASANNTHQELSYNLQPSWRSFRTFPLVRSAPVTIRVYTGLPASSLHHQYVLESIAQWSAALDGQLNIVVMDQPDNANIRFHWVKGFKDPFMAGEAISRIEDADIYIKTAGIPAGDIYANILHEFGHALGINGHSPYENDIMATARKWKRDTAYTPALSMRDRQAIQRLYSDNWQQGEDLYRVLTANGQ